MELPPATSAAATVFRGDPLACPDDGQTCAVKHEMDALAGRDRSQTAPQMLTAPGERRIVGGGEVEAHHPEQGRAGTLRPGAAGDGRGVAGSGRSRWRDPSSAAAHPAGRSGGVSRQRSLPRTPTPSHGVLARIVTSPHDANRQDPHLPMRYDTGRPRAVIRLRSLFSGSPTGDRALEPVEVPR